MKPKIYLKRIFHRNEWWLARLDYFPAKVPVPITIGIVSADGATSVYYLNRRAVSIYAGAKSSGQITYIVTVFASMTDRTNDNRKSGFL
jgi:hypothetical protein